MAIIQGVIIGIAAVAVVGFIIVSANGQLGNDQKEPEIPTAGPAPENKEEPIETAVAPLQLFARQHGVFSSSESAATFLAADSSLSSAAIFQIGDKYFIWSSMGLTETEIMDSESDDTFRKAITATVGTCEAVDAKVLRDSLVADTVAKIKISEGETEDEKVKVFNEQLNAITSFTNDIRVVRLHLLKHFSSKGDCIKISD